MKASLPFKYIISEKRERYYVVFDFRDDDNKRQRKWVGTGLSFSCATPMGATLFAFTTERRGDYFKKEV